MSSVPDYFFTQSAVIPFSKQDGEFRVLLITSRKKKRWVIPKGVKEPELSPAASATNEAFEEAGIRGAVSTAPIGSYRYEKWGGTCTVQVFTMDVSEVLEEWQESYRDREWLSLDEAAQRVQEPALKDMILSLSEFQITDS
jgi:phosphohistidine phosphatase